MNDLFGYSTRFASALGLLLALTLCVSAVHAAHAAEAAESVGAHTGEAAYWKMHNAIFEHQQETDDALDDEHLVRYAAEVSADPARVETDLVSGIQRTRVRADFRSGVRSGVSEMPTFFINGARFEGNWAHPRELARALDEALKSEVVRL